MTDLLPPPVPVQAPSEEKSRNCWLVGCSGCLIILALFVISCMVIFWQVKKNFMVEPFEDVDFTQAEKTMAETKLKDLKLFDSDGKVSEDFEMPKEGLILTEDEVNYWISQMDTDLADSVRIDFEPGELTAKLRFGEGKGKRLLFIAQFSVPHEDNAVDIRLSDLRFGKFSLPQSLKEELVAENFATEFFADPKTQKTFESKVEKIELQKDQILFAPKTN